MRKIFISVISLSMLCHTILYGQSVASFQMTDSVCAGSSINLINTSTGNTTNLWNFSVAGLQKQPVGLNLGVWDTLGETPTRITLIQSGSNYYLFATDQFDSSLTRVKFKGTYFDPAPSVTHLSGTLLQHNIFIPQGIQIGYDTVTGKWIGFVANSAGADLLGQIARLDFGNSLDNVPIVTLIDTVSGHSFFPHGMHLVKDGAYWYLLVASMKNFNPGPGHTPGYGFVDYRITRYQFSDSLTATPVYDSITATILGNSNMLNTPTSVKALEDNNGNWWALVLNNASPAFFTLMKFGNSLSNWPTGQILNTTGNNFLNVPYDFDLLKDCDNYYALIINGDNKAGLACAIFDSLNANPSIVGWGNMGNLNSANGISEVFFQHDTIVCFAINTADETTTRITFLSDTTLEPSYAVSPQNIAFVQPGTYNIRLNINYSNKNMFQSTCKTLTVLDSSVSICKKITIPTNPSNPSNPSMNTDPYVQLQIFPNPTNDIFNLVTECRGNYILTDISGHIVKNGSIASDQTQIDVSDLPAGCYFIKIQSSTGVVTNKLIKE